MGEFKVLVIKQPQDDKKPRKGELGHPCSVTVLQPGAPFHKHFVTIKHLAQGGRIPQFLQFFIHFNQWGEKSAWSCHNSFSPCRRGKEHIKKSMHLQRNCLITRKIIKRKLKEQLRGEYVCRRLRCFKGNNLFYYSTQICTT